MRSIYLSRQVLRMLFVPLLCLSLILLVRTNHASTLATPVNIRQILLTSAQTSDPDLASNNSGVILTHFSHVCELSTDDGKTIYVGDRRVVLAGMSAPRGLNYITFFAGDFTYLGKYQYINARPLWCDEGKLYLSGGLDGNEVSNRENVIDVSKGFQNTRLYYEEAYGSS